MKRRNFLKILPSAAITPFVVDGFHLRPFANRRMAGILGSCDGLDERSIVLIQLKGGNDGINTLIPINQYDTYANLREQIRIPDSGADQYIPLDNTLPDNKKIGLHPAMTALKEMYDNGLVQIIQGVGYESPNQSHFKSTDLWLSGGDGTPDNFNIHSGWMGRALQSLYPDVLGAPTPQMPDPLGIQVGDPNPSLGFHTETEHQNAINLSGQDPAGFYSLIQTIGGAPMTNIPDSDFGAEIEYIMAVEQSVNLYAQRITQVFNAGTNVGSYPNSNLASQLKTVARLIRGGSKTKIYLCSLGGFDTHSAQIPEDASALEGDHAELLRTLSEAVKAFFNDLQAMNIADKVVGCTFSEFGRCAKGNGSFGTDHGTLAPMFIFGSTVNPGVTGVNVNLANLTPDNQLLGMQSDYRQVFTTLLQDWLGAGNPVLEDTLFDGYAKLPLVAPTYAVEPDCYYGGVSAVSDADPAARNPLRVYPNPARYATEAVFESQQAFSARLSAFSANGSVVYSEVQYVQPGTNIFTLDVSNWPAGTYFLRLEDKMTGKAVVAKLVKQK
jgi:uncharacterized protein (DUF1501 family)